MAKAKKEGKAGWKDGFCITQHKGFRMTFANGWGISVQWGPGNYTEPRDFAEDWQAPMKSHYYSKRKAEIAIFNPGGDFHRPQEDWGDDVLGYVSADEVLKWMNYAAAQPSEGGR